MKDVAWREGRLPRSAQAPDTAAVGRTGLAPGLARSAPSALRGSTPSAEAQVARRICVTLVPALVPARKLSCRQRSRQPEQPAAAMPPALHWTQGPARSRLALRERCLRQALAVRHYSPPAREAAEAVVVVPILPETPRAIFHRCISHSCDRRSGSASASRARPRSRRGWAVAAQWRGSDNPMPLRRRDSGCWASFPDRGRSCWSPSNHAKCRRGCMRRAQAPTPEWRAGAPRTGRNGLSLPS